MPDSIYAEQIIENFRACGALFPYKTLTGSKFFAPAAQKLYICPTVYMLNKKLNSQKTKLYMNVLIVKPLHTTM